MTLTITTRDGRRQLRVNYSAPAGRSKQRLEAVELVLRPGAYIATRRGRRPRPVVLQRAHAATGRLTVALTPARVSRGITIALQYASGPQNLIALPHL